MRPCRCASLEFHTVNRMRSSLRSILKSHGFQLAVQRAANGVGELHVEPTIFGQRRGCQ
jgi:hypothetical protein